MHYPVPEQPYFFMCRIAQLFGKSGSISFEVHVGWISQRCGSREDPAIDLIRLLRDGAAAGRPKERK